MITQDTNNLKEDFGKTFQQLMPLVSAIACLDMAEELTLYRLEREAERMLGRSLTDYDRVFLRKEYERRQVHDWLVAMFKAYDQRLREDGMIRRIVWRRG